MHNRLHSSSRLRTLPLTRLLEEAFGNLYAARLRSLLALIGIIVGTASVIAMINAGRNAVHESTRQFQAMGTDIVMVRKTLFGGANHMPISLPDVTALPATVDAVSAVAPAIFFSARVSLQRKNADVGIVGATASLLDVARLSLLQGRFVSDFDRFGTFAVIGPEVANALSTPERRVQLGDAVRIEDYMFTIVGLIGKTVPNPLMGMDFNNAIIVPLDSMRRISPNPEISAIVVRLVPDADSASATASITNYFQSKAPDGGIQAQGAGQLIEAMQQQGRLFTYLLAGVGSISLLVGGIGVMNVMLTGVIERRREIGLRMAIGAHKGDILVMFLIEATALSLAGGGIGAVLGFVTAWAIAYFSGWQFTLSPVAIPIGVGMALVVGLCSGIYPAMTAARLHPIAALRAE
jgi:putative ABC transport system permease protein